MQFTIEENQFYIEDYYKPEVLAPGITEGIKRLKHSHALIVKEYQQAMQNDGQLIGLERIKITEHIEEAVESNILFILTLLSLFRQDEAEQLKVIDMSGELSGTDLKLTVMERRYSLRGRFLNSDVGKGSDFVKSLGLAVQVLGRTVEATAQVTADNQLTDESFAALNREIFTGIYRLLVLKQNIETLQINR
ncbi:MAG: hypothetical protein E4H36_00580 [Spirochaetales bacterium]|nr:MAG: hypothetical protein E4H36_00580 [Spirochaetales bacterium]